ncbi:hypothetical protein [Rhodococcus sp. OK302]|uniref:hypothetical protein n=1 Tax=Rhodococcus sp. OK302 TaxID=1882769 RepID=UPI000B9F6D4C|nr:hypothetical protein [Rhodococcus sp. OK302]OYD70953.1 hypothetical protein BDB13_4597 [Rhodococcus sp. OK302]
MTYSTNGQSTPPADGNRTLLVSIAIFSAITALVVVGFGVNWVYSTWKSNQIIDTLVGLSDPNSTSDLEGSWSGIAIYTSGTEVTLDASISKSSPISGSFTFGGEVRCVVSLSETSREYGTIYVDTKAVGSSSDCAQSSEWAITLTGNTMTGKMNWSTTPTLEGMTLSIHKNS